MYNIQLIPKKIKHVSSFKTRSVKTINVNSQLTYGNYGLRSLNHAAYTSKQLVKLLLYFKRFSRKPDKTKRYYWLKAFPHLPLTKKSKGVRMGKGKGKRFLWYTIIKAYLIFIEFKNHRWGRFNYYFKNIKCLLNIVITPVYLTSKLNYLASRNYKTYNLIWL